MPLQRDNIPAPKSAISQHRRRSAIIARPSELRSSTPRPANQRSRRFAPAGRRGRGSRYEAERKRAESMRNFGEGRFAVAVVARSLRSATRRRARMKKNNSAGPSRHVAVVLAVRARRDVMMPRHWP